MIGMTNSGMSLRQQVGAAGNKNKIKRKTDSPGKINHSL